MIERTNIRSGASFARGTTIDEYLPADVNAALYEKWDNAWGEPLTFHGGVTAITCEMILEVPEEKLFAVFGKKTAQILKDVSERNAAR